MGTIKVESQSNLAFDGTMFIKLRIRHVESGRSVRVMSTIGHILIAERFGFVPAPSTFGTSVRFTCNHGQRIPVGACAGCGRSEQSFVPEAIGWLASQPNLAIQDNYGYFD